MLNSSITYEKIFYVFNYLIYDNRAIPFVRGKVKQYLQ